MEDLESAERLALSDFQVNNRLILNVFRSEKGVFLERRGCHQARGLWKCQMVNSALRIFIKYSNTLNH